MSGQERRSCFVIMPFGTRVFSEVIEPNEQPDKILKETQAKIRHAVVDFDEIYEKIIKAAVEGVEHWKLECTRSDEVKQAGVVHRDMIRRIIEADVVIVDVTLNNPNVFYELGIRHSLRRSTTVVIKRIGFDARYPFNIASMRAVEYDTSTPEGIAKSMANLKGAIQASFQGKDVDSLVHTLFNDIMITRNQPPIMEQIEIQRTVAAAPSKTVGYVSGDIANVRTIDAWVNAENTKMEMGRLHDDSISSTIRFYGASRDTLNYVLEDHIREELDCLLSQRGKVGVEPGTVLITGPGCLAARNNVKVVLHVAALHGEPGKGYLPVRDYPGCVTRVLTEIEALNAGRRIEPLTRRVKGRWSSRERRVRDEIDLNGQIKSVVIPLFGSRTTGQHPQDVSDQLFRAACVFFEMHPKCTLEKVLFLAYTGNDKQYCEGAIGSLDRSGRLSRDGRPNPDGNAPPDGSPPPKP